MLYGALPKDLGLIDINPTEMLFWLYCPIKVPGTYGYTLPDNLKQFEALVIEALVDFDPFRTPRRLKDHYVYLTAKTLYVEGTHLGNRPGWHSDGFGTADINYIWADRAPTDFLRLETPLPLSTDCAVSMREMADFHRFGCRYDSTVVTYPDKHLLRLDESVIHRSPVKVAAGMRTFVKVSISKDRYDLAGNSINHKLPASRWDLVDRQPTRNHPASRSAP